MHVILVDLRNTHEKLSLVAVSRLYSREQGEVNHNRDYILILGSMHRTTGNNNGDT